MLHVSNKLITRDTRTFLMETVPIFKLTVQSFICNNILRPQCQVVMMMS